MDSFQKIELNLSRFIRQYYISALLRGLLLFLSIGLLFALFLLVVEHFLWLGPFGRTVLFWLIVTFESVIFYAFIASPIFKLIKVQKGIDFETASKIIGDHFPEVKDKLLNVLQLNQQPDDTELLLASIEQKANTLKSISFKNAVVLSKNIKYIKYAALPLIIISLFFSLGKQYVFTESFKRVVNYQTPYTPPAPFEFTIVNSALITLEGASFKLVVNTKGSVVPEEAQIVYEGDTYLLNAIKPGVFEYQFIQPKKTVKFKLFSGDVTSQSLELTVVPTPVVLSLDLYVNPPKYTQQPPIKIANNGNAIVQEGAKLRWELLTKSTDTLVYLSDTGPYFFQKEGQKFTFNKQVFQSQGYTIETSNSKLKRFESLDYSIGVIKDQLPRIDVEMKKDSTLQQTLYFYGQVSDDYGIRELKLYYYPTDDPSNLKALSLPFAKKSPQEFTAVFPSSLELIDDTPYSLYFEVLDNDPINNYKSTRSRIFKFQSKSLEALETRQINAQRALSSAFQKALKAQAQQDKNLKEISENQKETPKLDYNDKRKLNRFLERQKAQDKLLEKFNKTMQDNLNQFKKKDKDVFKEQLQKRLKAQQESLQKNEKLLEEIEKIANKINKEQLAEKLDEMAKQSQNKQRSLEQLLELTKKYYVSKKAAQINTQLKALSKEQERLAKGPPDENLKSAQDKLNKKFEALMKELDSLKKENDTLSKPLKIPDDPALEESISKDQKQALEDLEQQQPSTATEKQKSQLAKAQKSQKKAAQKMLQLSQNMSQQMAGGGAQQMSEDIAVLRQILDNLILFSFEQEALMNRFVLASTNSSYYAKQLVKQSALREHFEHIEDSLFSLSLRQPMISETINSEITEVFFNIDKSLALLAENELRKGTSSQQFVMMATNKLADMLSSTLDNMESQLQLAPGTGESEIQLPDIIMSQEALSQQMQQKLGDKSKGSEAKEGQEGEEGEKSNGDKDGKQGPSSQGENGQGKSSGGNKDASSPSSINEGINGQESGYEEDIGEIFEIFKQQQELRTALQDLLKQKGLLAEENKLLKAMDKISENLINQGVTQKSLDEMKTLKHQLLKLERATQQQGEDVKRVSDANQKTISEAPLPSSESIKQYFNTIEILKKQSLPLHLELKKKVQDYFKNNND